MTTPRQNFESNGCRLTTTDGRTLPLQGVALKAEAAAGLARVVLTQRFANPFAEPLHVTYLMPLPADGAVAGYSFRIGDRRIVGEIDRRRAARERFEQALVEGRTAALLDEERGNLFTQQLGNVPPGVEVTVELTVDQPLRFLSAREGWEWRFPTVAAPRYLGAEGRVADARGVTVDVADRRLEVRATLALSIGDLLADERQPESPTHRLLCRREAGRLEVTLPEEGAALDRDLVVRWPVSQAAASATLARARAAAGQEAGGVAHGLLTVVPPGLVSAAVPRDLVVLLDVSGSMGGRPLDHARRVVSAVVDSLAPDDSLELIAFSDRPHHWKREPCAATPAARKEALAWLGALRASGGTEMKAGIEAALRPLRADAQRQVLLVTDGHIGFEAEVVREVRDHLPVGSRLHTVGVGSGINRSLTGPAARAGRGVEIVVDLDEDAERGAARLVAATWSPVVVDLTVEGPAVRRTANRKLPDLMAGSPALVPLELDPAGGSLTIRGRTARGPWELRLAVPATAPGEGSPSVVALFGRERVEELEVDLAAGAERRETDAQIERLGLTFGIATRLTSFVAVSERVDVDPLAPTRRTAIPQELPYGMSAEGLGLRAPAGAAAAPAAPMRMLSSDRAAFAGLAGSGAAQGFSGQFAEADDEPSPEQSAPDAAADELIAEEPAPRSSGSRAPGGKAKKAEAPAKRKLVSREEAREDRDEAPAERAASPAGAAPEHRPEPPPHGQQPASSSGAPRKPGAPGPTPTPAAAPGALRLLKGKRLAGRGGTVVIEVQVDGLPLAWAPPETVEVELEDGTRLTLRLDLARTTRAGTVAAGTALRLALLPGAQGGARPRTLQLSIAGWLLRIEVE